MRILPLLFLALSMKTLGACDPDEPPQNRAASDLPASRGGGWNPGGAAGIPARRATAQAEVGEATRAFDSVGDDCSDLCVQLDRLRAGVQDLCSVDEGKDDQKRCKDAKADLIPREARASRDCSGCKPAGSDGGVDAHVERDEAGDPLP